HLGGIVEFAVEGSATQSGGAHLIVLVQGQGSGDPGDRATVARGQRARGFGAQKRRPVTDHGPAHPRRRRYARPIRKPTHFFCRPGNSGGSSTPRRSRSPTRSTSKCSKSIRATPR